MQLGLTSFVFPGATHTRFSHSLGAAFLARRVLMHLDEQAVGAERQEIEEYRLLITLAALLHDVGHGPFSHSFENVLKGFPQIVGAPDHEEWTISLIRGAGSDINEALRSVDIDTELLAALFTKKGNLSLPLFLKQIVSSQLDVDRMDYLARDSHFAGVEVGKIDLWYLIHSLTVVPHGNGQLRTLGLSTKGVKPYEAFVIARQLMNRTIYFHPKVKALEFTMEYFLRLVLENEERLASIDVLRYSIPAYLRMVATAIRDRSFKKDEFLERARDAYRDLTEDSVWHLIRSMARELPRDDSATTRLKELALGLLRRKSFEYLAVDAPRQVLFKEALVRAGFVEGVDFAAVQLKTTAYKEGENEVFVLSAAGAQPVSDHSFIISTMQDRAESESLMMLLDPSRGQEFHAAAASTGAISPL
jgi:HD superfamily phosphohydrolase